MTKKDNLFALNKLCTGWDGFAQDFSPILLAYKQIFMSFDSLSRQAALSQEQLENWADKGSVSQDSAELILDVIKQQIVNELGSL